MVSRIEFHKIESEKKIRKSAELVYFEYAKDGYFDQVEENDHIPVSKHKLLKTSKNFAAFLEGNIVGTVTVVGDSEHGLPMDELYKKEIDIHRKKGHRIAEISQLAIVRDVERFSGINKRFFQSVVLTSLLRCVFYQVKNSDVGMVTIAINPKHYDFYKSLGFFEIGGLKYYPFVNNAPAYAKALMIDSGLEKRAPDNLILREIIKDPIGKDLLEREGDNLLFHLEL